MKKRLKLTEKKRNELLSHFSKNNEIALEEVIEIVFELKIPPNYTNLPDSYPIEIRRDYLRLNTALVMIADLVKQHCQVSKKIAELQAENAKVNNELEELLEKQKELVKNIKPLIAQLLDLIKNIKESGFDITKN